VDEVAGARDRACTALVQCPENQRNAKVSSRANYSALSALTSEGSEGKHRAACSREVRSAMKLQFELEDRNSTNQPCGWI
jgi:hypothetical protein